MTLRNDTEVANTREKLRELEMRYARRQKAPPPSPTNERVHELTMASLKRMINQLKEEITLYEIHQTTVRS